MLNEGELTDAFIDETLTAHDVDVNKYIGQARGLKAKGVDKLQIAWRRVVILSNQAFRNKELAKRAAVADEALKKEQARQLVEANKLTAIAKKEYEVCFSGSGGTFCHVSLLYFIVLINQAREALLPKFYLCSNVK